MLKLSPRLQTFFDLFLPKQPVWDFCCDHGYVGLKALEAETFPEVHFVDPVPHLIQKIKYICDKHEAVGAHFHCSHGEELAQDILGNVLIAGVGAETIITILKSLHERGYLKAKRLILSPHRHEDRLDIFMEQLCLKYSLNQQLSVPHKQGGDGRQYAVRVFERVQNS